MIHFLYLVGFGALIGVVFGAISNGTAMEKLWYGTKTFLQFVGISLAIAWLLYFIPW
ncbi:MAG TPA: hypothetical protein VK612_06685 [Pyrinomonadaceae bacterium]|nr:hypothetical protein [Pyrinomonadaceae bacterium]